MKSQAIIDTTPLDTEPGKDGDVELDNDEKFRALAAGIGARALGILDTEERETFFRTVHEEYCAVFFSEGGTSLEAREKADRLIVLARVMVDQLKFELARRISAGLRRCA